MDAVTLQTRTPAAPSPCRCIGDPTTSSQTADYPLNKPGCTASSGQGCLSAFPTSAALRLSLLDWRIGRRFNCPGPILRIDTSTSVSKSPPTWTIASRSDEIEPHKDLLARCDTFGDDHDAQHVDHSCCEFSVPLRSDRSTITQHPSGLLQPNHAPSRCHGTADLAETRL